MNPLQGMAYVQQQGELGRQRGQQNRLAALASQAYAAPVDQQRGLVQQAIATNPDAGFGLGKSLQDDKQQRLAGMSQKARMLVAYAKSGNRAGVDGLYPQIAQEAQALGLGQNIPPTWDDSYLAGMEQLANMGGAAAGNTVQSQKVGEDGYIYNTMRDGTIVNTGVKADRQMWFRDHPGMAPELVGKDGSIRAVGGNAPQGEPQGPTRDTMEADVQLANAMVAAGIPADRIDAFLATRGQQASQMAQQAPQQYAGAQARPSEAQIAAQTEAAKLGVQMQYAPAQQAIETQGAIERAAGVKSAEASVTQQAERQKQQRERDTVFAQYQAAITGLRSGLANSNTGPIAGRLPALTANQQIAEGSVAALAPVLKQLFRAAGEGTFTDRDQALLLEMVPTRTDLPAAREAKLQNIDNIVRAKLGQGGMYGRPAPSDGPVGGAPVRVQSADDYNRLPSGATYIAPDGSQRRKR